MTVTLNLAPDLAQQLQRRAAENGQTLESYLEQLATLAVADATRTAAPDTEISGEEFSELLDRLDATPTVPPLPADFCRADLYLEHD